MRVRYFRKRYQKNLQETSVAEVSPDNHDRIVDQQRTGDAEDVGP